MQVALAITDGPIGFCFNKKKKFFKNQLGCNKKYEQEQVLIKTWRNWNFHTVLVGM